MPSMLDPMGLLSNPMLMMGLGMLGQAGPRSSTMAGGPGPGNAAVGAMQGLQAAQQAQYQLQMMAEQMRQREAAAEQQRLAQNFAVAQAGGSYSEEGLRAMAAQAYPEQAAAQYFRDPPKRQTLQDAGGFHRFVDSGQRVFPGVQGAAEAPDYTDVSSMRKEYQGLSKDWITVRDNYEQIQSAKPTGAGDTALIFGLMKIFDPASVVREGEQATAANAAGVPEAIRGYWNYLEGGGRLSVEARRQLKEQATAVFQARVAHQLQRQEDFTGLAQRQGWNSADVVRDLVGRHAGQPGPMPGTNAIPPAEGGVTDETLRLLEKWAP